MASANQAYRTARDYGEDLSRDAGDFVHDLSKRAGRGASNAEAYARDAYEQAHEASKQYPHVTLALAAGLGFLFGVIAARR